MQKPYSLFIFLLSFNALLAQTVLQPGDIAIVQVKYTTTYSFDFVSFVDIEAGTRIWFTDYAYSLTVNDLDETTVSDGKYLFVATELIPAGQVVSYRNPYFVNPMFSKTGTELTFRSIRDGEMLEGENLFIYQEDAQQNKTFLFAMGWMRKDNFSVNPSNPLAKSSNVPPGLTRQDYTVIQLDSIMRPGQNPVLARDFRYRKQGGFEGTPFMIRRWLSDTYNYDTSPSGQNNNPVDNFNVLPGDALSPVVQTMYPVHNQTDVSPNAVISFLFDKKVMVTPSKLTIIRNMTNGATAYYSSNSTIVDGARISFVHPIALDPQTTYQLEIPKGYLTDENNNPWPVLNDTVFTFATSPLRSVHTIDFTSYNVIKNSKWVQLSSVPGEFDMELVTGYWSFVAKGIPFRLYQTNLLFESSDIEFMNPKYNLPSMTGPDSYLIADLSGITGTLSSLNAEVYENGCYFATTLLAGGHVLQTDTVKGVNASPLERNYNKYVVQHFANPGMHVIDSVRFRTYEGWLLKLSMEFIHTQVPVLSDLGADRLLCQGDSLLLDAGFSLGADYLWNTGETDNHIWVKESGFYEVTATNSQGSASASVTITVMPQIVSVLPDTIFACPGDTVTLIAGDESQGYFWGLSYPDNTPVRKVTNPGWYMVLIGNGEGACMMLDSVYVEYLPGAKVSAYFYQGGMTGYEDVTAELYKKEPDGFFKLFKTKLMPQIVDFDSLPAGDYILKATFTGWSFEGDNPFMDTYHDESSSWEAVTPFTLTCETDTMIGFPLLNRPFYDLTGSASIYGKVIHASSVPVGVGQFRVKSSDGRMWNTRVMLYDGDGDLISFTYPDDEGNYLFENLPRGVYKLGVDITGYSMDELITVSLTDETVSILLIADEESFTVRQGVVSVLPRPLLLDIHSVNVYPNPVQDGLAQVSLFAETESKVIVAIYNSVGKRVNSITRFLHPGVNKWSLDTNLIPGVYSLLIIDDQHNYRPLRFVVK
jgi:hypothetical protein